MNDQREMLAEALRLATENPEAEIHVLATSDELVDEFAWTGHVIFKVELGWWYVHDERILVDPSELSEYLDDEAFDECGPAVTEDDARGLMVRAILIYTRAG